MELQPNEIAISKQEYNSLLQNNAKIETLEKKIADLEQESKNKSTALSEARSKAKEEKESLNSQINSQNEQLENIKKVLGLSEGEEIDGKLAEVLSGFASYKEVLKKEEETRKTNIEEYKKTLGEEFLTSKADLLNGLDDKKTEILLKEFVNAKGGQEKIEIGVHNNGGSVEEKKSNFDKAVSSGASSAELLEAMIK